MNGAQDRLERHGLLFEQPANVNARCLTGAPQRHDTFDLRERQAQPTALLDERQKAENLIRIDAVPGGGTTGRAENAACLVYP